MTRQKGFGAVMAIVVLVFLAGIAASIVSINSTQQYTIAQDVLSAKAWLAAKAGDEWGLYYALKTQDWNGANTSCDTATQSKTLDLTADTGMYVTITCDSWLYNEGETTPGVKATTRLYRITAVACPSSTCPINDATVSRVGYVERRRIAIATAN